MNEKVAKWIIEFLLRQTIDEKIINGVLSSLPISNNDNRTKKTILLRNIELEVSNGLVSEKLLEFLEIIEELDHREGKKASNSMKEAYCAVAVDCTVRFLEDNLEDNRKYLETVENVWKNRVCKMEGLVSEESKRWLGDIEAAVQDSDVCEKIWMRNTRNEALKAVKSYVKEAWKFMGPAFLELMATKVGDEVQELCRGRDGGGAVVDTENPCRQLVASQGIQNSQASARRKHVAVKTRRPRGAKICNAVEDAEESMNAASDDPTSIMDKVRETHQSASMQLHAGVNVSHLDASQAAHNSSFTEAKDSTSNTDAAKNMTVPLTHAPPEVEASKFSSGELDVAVTDPCPDVLKLSFTKANESRSNVKTAKNTTVPVIHATSEVNRVQEALKSSSRELHEAVIDPLPEVDNLPFAKSKDGTSNMDAAKKDTVSVIHATPEVNRVQEALISSSRELQAAVIDPLPEALKLAATLSHKGVTGNDETAAKNQTGAEIHAIPRVDSMQQASEPRSMKVHAAVQNSIRDTSQPGQNVPSKMAAKDMSNDPVSANIDMSNDPALAKVDMSNDPALANQTQDVPRESTDKNIENCDKKDEHNGKNQANGTHDLMELRKRKRSLMERNGTSHTLEWDDSIDNLSCEGPRLGPSPNRGNRSPLKPYVERKIRRERKKWTPQEEDVLRDAVRRFGRRWKDILDSHDIFQGRTDVDLKDKWRNMTRT